ncbi:outer membrane beta-barrel protein [Pontibacter pamirensis]|uniref:outer membrane beta-barrel protein n=1 Tax=Pontibacter pamirensis TaxID=2562824 RepID=UPI00138A2EAF|nr:outer membrane beta-barrel protein [Pontibacter pamirensis]
MVTVVSVQAQQQGASEPPSKVKRETFVGVGISVVPYEAVGNPKYRDMHGLGLPFITLHYGYRLSKRTSIQVGLGYGFNEMSMGGTSRYIKADSIYMKQSQQSISAVIAPIRLNYTPFNPNRRLQLSGHVSIAPVYRHIQARSTESLNGGSEPIELYNDNSSSFTVVATAGLALSYRLSNRLSVYGEGTLSYFNFESQNARTLKNGSKGIGINYRL